MPSFTQASSATFSLDFLLITLLARLSDNHNPSDQAWLRDRFKAAAKKKYQRLQCSCYEGTALRKYEHCLKAFDSQWISSVCVWLIPLISQSIVKKVHDFHDVPCMHIDAVSSQNHVK